MNRSGPPRPRLCLLFPHVVLGGGEIAMMEIAEGLGRCYEVCVAALDPRDAAIGPTIRGELGRRFTDLRLLDERWQLRRLLGEIDVLLWYGLVPQVPRTLLRLERRPLSVRVVHTERPADGVGFQRRWSRAIDGVVCVHPGIARRIPGAVFVPNPGSTRYLQGPRQAFFKTEPGSSRKTLGFLGRLVPLKNVPWLIENVERLGCNLLFQVLDTELLRAAELEELARRRGVLSRVRFLPAQRDVGTLLRSVDALVIASRHEGFPMVAVEAGLLGVPVISTRVGALPELFAEEITFVDVVDGVPDVASLAAALDCLGPSQGEALRRKVSRLCAAESVTASYVRYLESLRERRSP